MTKYVFFLIILIFLGGCAKPPPHIDTKIQDTLPHWYTNPKLDNDLYMYSLGSGIDKNDAITDALNNFASKLGTTIESTFHSNINTNSINGLIYKNTTNNIKAYVSQIRISNYEILSVQKINYNESIVELRIDKTQFTKTLNRQLLQQINRYKQKVKSIESKNILAKYLELEPLVKNSKKIIPDIMVLKQLNNSFKYIQILSFINDIEDKYNNIKNEITFFVKFDKNSEKFASVIKNSISKNKLNLVNKSTTNSVNVHVSTVNRISKISEAIQISVYIIEVNTDINNYHIGGNKYILKERYNGSDALSMKNAVLHFREEINLKDLY